MITDHPAPQVRTNAPVPARPRDVAFQTWAADAFTWLPEQGMGRLHVHQAPYDQAYFQKYEGYAATPMGEAITRSRLELVHRFHPHGELVDVGIGCGDFVQARNGRPWGRTWGYDVNPEGIRWLNERQLFLSPYHGVVEAVSLWDVLEHIPEPAALLANVRSWVFTSVPLVPGDWGPPPPDWKHLRRDEHCWYWNRRGLVAWFRAQGFELAEENRLETLLGREDVGTFAFRRA